MLRAAAFVAPDGVGIELYDGLGDLPAFNPDLDDDEPQQVFAFRERMRDADAVLISTPEYAHGLPGALKNALDWLVSRGELLDKRAGVINVSPRSVYAHAQLIETLTVMNWKVVVNETMAVHGHRLDPPDDEIAAALREAIHRLIS